MVNSEEQGGAFCFAVTVGRYSAESILILEINLH